MKREVLVTKIVCRGIAKKSSIFSRKKLWEKLLLLVKIQQFIYLIFLVELLSVLAGIPTP